MTQTNISASHAFNLATGSIIAAKRRSNKVVGDYYELYYGRSMRRLGVIKRHSIGVWQAATPKGELTNHGNYDSALLALIAEI